MRYRQVWLAVLHSVLITMALMGAFVLRFDFSVEEPYRGVMFRAIPVVLPVKLLVFHFFNLFQGWWRYVGLSDLIGIGKATLAGSIGGFIALFIVNGLVNVPRSVFVLDLALTFLLVGGVRFMVRAYTETGRAASSNPRIRVLLVGAGATGNTLVREMKSNRNLHYEPIGFVDDNRAKHGARVQGLEVFGPISEIPVIAVRHAVQEVLLAVPSATGRQMRRITGICQEAGLPFKTIPAVGDLIAGRVSIHRLREVQIEDLLGRRPARLDLERIRHNIREQRVLVTGAAGSIGSELCRQIAQLHPAHLIMLDRTESELCDLSVELNQLVPEVAVIPAIGDILDPAELEEIFRTYRPTRVYHAAAYKHVPIMERHVVSVVRHNVIGTINVATAAAAHRVEQFVLISSDKAVRPTSLMGATKRGAERALFGMTDPNSTRFLAVRFGNVLGSSGSVVPLFRKQIAAGGPVTVTHSDVVRYFMTIPEAVQLVLQASSMSVGREIFHLDMGEPIRIVDLAENMIRLSGLELGKDIEIKLVGLRPGEKLFEELLTEGEGVLPTSHSRIRVISTQDAGLPAEWLSEVRRAVERRDAAELVRLIQLGVPEYTPSTVVEGISKTRPFLAAKA